MPYRVLIPVTYAWHNVQLGETLTTVTEINNRVRHGLKTLDHGAPPRRRSSSRRHAAVAAREKILTLTQIGEHDLHARKLDY